MPSRLLLVFALLAAGAQSMMAARAETAPRDSTGALDALLKAYPAFLDRIEGNDLVWKDGARMPIDDGLASKSFDALLDAPDIKDMFSMPYPAGDKGNSPEVNADPGRVRFMPMFEKMYGDCRAAKAQANAADVVWLPSKDGRKLKFTSINGAATALQHVSNELDLLPASFLPYLKPPAGTINCRPIAGTTRASAHGFGIAIDIAVARAHYWRWSKPGQAGAIPYKNAIPWDIVRIFEQHGFIWGGKWYHYDTMHFEYRPELLGGAK